MGWKEPRSSTRRSAKSELERNNTMHQYMLGADQLESSLEEENLVDTKLNTRQKCALAKKKVNDIWAG